MQAGSFSYQDILNKIQKSWQEAHSKNQYEYANDPLYNLVLFLQSNDVSFSGKSREAVNDTLMKAGNDNVSGVTAEDMVFIVEQINKSIYSSIVENNNQEPLWHKRKSVKSFFYQSDFANNLLFSFISSTSNDNGINNYGIYTVQAAMCVKKLISENENDNLFYGKHKNDLINALDLPERDNAAALCRLMYVKKLSGKDALKSIKDILKSVMEYKFKGKNDFISIAYCKYFCAQIDKLQLNNEFSKQIDQIVDSANSFFGKDFVPDLDKIKEFLPEFKMPDRYISPERLRQIALSDVGRENAHLVDEQRRLKREVMKQQFKPEDDVFAWKSHYEKLINFYDAFRTKDVNPVDNLTSGQKDYDFLCRKAEIFKAVIGQSCKEEKKSTQRVEYYYDNIQIVNNVTQKIIDALKSDNDNKKNMTFGFIDFLVPDKQTANIDQLQIIDKILSEESQVDKDIKLTALTIIKKYFEAKAKDAEGLELQYKNGSTKDFDKAIENFVESSKNNLPVLKCLADKDIIKKDAYEQYKTRLDNATDLNLIITALYWFVNLLGTAISLGQWNARIRAVKSPEKVRIFNRIPKSLDIESDKNEELHQ